MDQPKLTWYVQLTEENKYSAEDEKYIGTYSLYSPIIAYLRLWNNRYGSEEVESLRNFALRLSFDSYEDSVFLPFCTMFVGTEELPANVAGKYALFTIPRTKSISGKKNNGNESENKENYLDFTLKFRVDDKTARSKENDIKNLSIEVVPI